MVNGATGCPRAMIFWRWLTKLKKPDLLTERAASCVPRDFGGPLEVSNSMISKFVKKKLNGKTVMSERKYIKVYEKPVPRTKKIPQCQVKLEAGERRIVDIEYHHEYSDSTNTRTFWTNKINFLKYFLSCFLFAIATLLSRNLSF